MSEYMVQKLTEVYRTLHIGGIALLTTGLTTKSFGEYPYNHAYAAADFIKSAGDIGFIAGCMAAGAGAIGFIVTDWYAEHTQVHSESRSKSQKSLEGRLK